MVNEPLAQGPFLSAGSVTTAAALPDKWWRLYDDPALDRLVTGALEANTDLRVAEANLRRNLALLDARGATRQVQGSADFETSYAQRSAEAELQHVQPPMRQIYNTGIGLSYDLDLFGGLERGIEAAAADADAAVAARDLVRVNVAAETARAYADICNSGYQLVLVMRVVQLQEQGVRLTGTLVRFGRVAPMELDRRRGALETAKARLPRLTARQRNALFRIAVLQGRVPGEADEALLECGIPLRLVQAIPVGDGGALIRRRPDIRMAERRLAASTARIGVETAALYPDIRLGASAGSTGALADLFSPLTNRLGIGPLINWTLNRHAARARIVAARAQGEADLASFDGAVIRSLREVESALTFYAADAEAQEDLERTRDAMAMVTRRTRVLRLGGRISPLSQIDAERDLAAAELAAAEGRAAMNDDQITLFLSLGGGWEMSAGEARALGN